LVTTENTKLVRANSIEEWNQAIQVGLSSFYPNGHSSAHEMEWKHRWSNAPTFLPERVLLAKTEHHQIIGGIRVKPITVGRQDQSYNCLGIADIFTTTNTRGFGVAAQIVKFVIQIAEEEKYYLIIGVARKLIDGFYIKHNFFGVGS
jgi:predicted N-acetyltransferase YhbS